MVWLLLFFLRLVNTDINVFSYDFTEYNFCVTSQRQSCSRSETKGGFSCIFFEPLPPLLGIVCAVNDTTYSVFRSYYNIQKVDPYFILTNRQSGYNLHGDVYASEKSCGIRTTDQSTAQPFICPTQLLKESSVFIRRIPDQLCKPEEYLEIDGERFVVCSFEPLPE